MLSKTIKILFYGIFATAIFFVVFFYYDNFFTTKKNINIGPIAPDANQNIENLNKEISREVQKDDAEKKYKIYYKIKPKVMFGSNNSEIINFEAHSGVKFILRYGTTTDYEYKIQNDIFQNSHEIALNDLTQGTKYFFKISIYSDNGGYNEDHSSFFVTKNDLKNNLHFAVLGDGRPDKGTMPPKELYAIVSSISKRNPNFVVFAGDMVQLSDVKDITYDYVDTVWKYFSDAVFPITSNIPLYLVVGNHDEPTNNNSIQRYRDVWNFPHNGGGKIGWFDEVTYWFDYGKNVFIVLNSEEPGFKGSMSPEQLEWLKKTLALKGYEHKFIFIHRPIMGSKREVNKKSKELHNLFLKNNVAAVFSGHDHLYCKTKYNSIYYIITGGAGSPLYKNVCEGKEISQYHFIDVEITENGVDISAVDMSGKVIDGFRI